MWRSNHAGVGQMFSWRVKNYSFISLQRESGKLNLAQFSPGIIAAKKCFVLGFSVQACFGGRVK
jgi:chromate transport protein ChrA